MSSTALSKKFSVYYSFCVTLSPAGHGSSFSDGITPQVETHTNDGAGQEDREHHQGADQQVKEGIEDGAVGKGKTLICAWDLFFFLKHVAYKIETPFHTQEKILTQTGVMSQNKIRQYMIFQRQHKSGPSIFAMEDDIDWSLLQDFFYD